MKQILLYFIVLFVSLFFISSVLSQPKERIYGVTIDAVNNLSAIKNSLSRHNKRPTTRIVFDEFVPASEYRIPVDTISRYSDIMGEILDSYYMSQYSVQEFKDRTVEYINLLGNQVYIWEIGNEVNGEWLGHTDSTIAKINYSFLYAKKMGYKAALTLYYNKDCWEYPQHEMFRWTIANIPYKMKQVIDYVFVSYYEDDCNNLQPNWQQVFDSLHTIFPNSKLGIGECGTRFSARKVEYMTRYYSMNITTPNYVGGYFWWYYKQDCVPYTRPLWAVLNNLFNLIGDDMNYNTPSDLKFNNYPNPFNPNTTINYKIENPSKVLIKVYDIIGREITVLVNDFKDRGEYQVDFNAVSLSSGIYYTKIEAGGNTEIRKMVLIK